LSCWSARKVSSVKGGERNVTDVATTDSVEPGSSHRGLFLLSGLVIALAAAPLFVSPYILSVLTLALYFAYMGQAWNIMMGFAGLLSLGHSLYFGIGAYTSAALFTFFGVPPWLGMIAGAILAAAAGAFIGFLSFRFRVGGVYFAILTIAFAEFARIAMDHLSWTGGSAGFFIHVANRTTSDLWQLRGGPVMFYYVWLALTVLLLFACRMLVSSRTGHFWLAIREDEDAAQALGIDVVRYKLSAIMLSAAVTAAGGVVYAFYNNNLFPASTFSVPRSIEMLLGTVAGGVGTLMGPIVGAFILTPLGEILTVLVEPFKSGGLKLDGIKQVFYGVCVVAIVIVHRHGIWPVIARKLNLSRNVVERR
jgi:branched-chain amino acid transport system permease protein